MKLSIAIINSLAALAYAAPAPISGSKTPERANLALQARMNRHARLMNKRNGGGPGSGGSHRQGQESATSTVAVAVAAATTSATSSAAAATSTATTKQSSSSNDEYNENWAGVVVQGDEGSVTGVTGTFTLPTVELPTTGDQLDATYHTASTWIGIDGYSCGTGLWQAGVDGTIDESGSVTWYAWYEWYPADTVSVDLGDLATGDVSLTFCFFSTLLLLIHASKARVLTPALRLSLSTSLQARPQRVQSPCTMPQVVQALPRP